jgi:predicted phosphohydrolase
LIFDDTWINSSFDWLSFRGGPERIYRREEGTLIRATDVVNEKYSEVLAAIK